MPPIRLAGVALVAIGLVAAAAHGASVARTCVRDACRPQSKQCLQAFRGKKQPALAACAGAGSAKVCRATARQAAKSGMQACRASMRDCVACCKATGGGCHVAACGNELVEGGEACDGASAGSCAGDCRDDCTCAPVAACGNATVDEGEQCDGASDSACPGRCRADCTCGPPPPTCGNGVVDAGEQCDGASHAACEIACGADCTCVAPVCGNGVLGGTEACDGASDAACPGHCLEDCTCEPPSTCGNDVVEPGEACEPGLHDSACSVGCLPDCTCAVCGNDVIEAPVETCEPTDDAACPGLCSSESCQCLSPTTDTCEGARELATFPALDRQSTIGATTDGTDPAFACGFEGAAIPHQGTVWYAFVAPGTGRVTADTGGSFLDSVLAAYTGTCGALSMVACNDDTPSSLNARVEFPVAGGTRYLLQAAAYTGEVPGDLVMAVDFTPCGDGVLDPDEACDPNLPGSCPNGACTVHCECLDLAADECADAAVATELPIHLSLAASQTTGAATDPVLSCVFNFAEPPSAWFRFVAPMDGVVDVATIGGNYDTVLGLFTGDCGALTEVDCNDDVSPTVYQSRLVQMVTAGTTYTVLVTNYRDDPPDRLELTIAYE